MNAKKIGILFSPELDEDRVISCSDEFSYAGLNTGNLAFVSGVKNIIAGDVEFIGWTSDPEYVNENFSSLILPAANQLGIHSDFTNLVKIWSKYNIPIAALGLGLQAPLNSDPKLNAGTLEWLELLLRSAQNSGSHVGVRGNKTKKFIESLFEWAPVKVIGCPSQFIATSSFLSDSLTSKVELGKLGNFKNLLLNAGHLSWNKTHHAERLLILELIKNKGCYLIQEPLDAYSAARFPLAEPNEKFYDDFSRIYGDALSDHGLTAESFFKSYAFADYDFQRVCSKIRRKCDYSIGFRIHGTMAGLAAGLPSLLVKVDERTTELSDSLGIPNVDIDYIKSQNSIEFIKTAMVNFDYQKMIQKWRENAIQVAEILDGFHIRKSSHFTTNWLN